MITIIRKGQLPEEKPKKVECDRCKTIFTYTKEDVKPDQRDGDYVECPTCKAFINDK